MSTSDWATIAFNTLALMMAVVGLATQHTEPMSIALVLAIVSVLLNSSRILRRPRAYERVPESSRQLESEDEMDIHRVLDLDQRLEALERAEERRLLALADAGIISAPEAPEETHVDAHPTRQRV